MSKEQTLPRRLFRLSAWSNRVIWRRKKLTPASSFEGLGQQTGIAEAVLHDGSESFEAKMNKVIVLRDDLSTRAREVEGVGLFCAAQIVQLEDQVLWKERFISPDDPANTLKFVSMRAPAKVRALSPA